MKHTLCPFCKFPFTIISIIGAELVEGIEKTTVKCTNCRAEILVSVEILKGPKNENYIKNVRGKNDGQQAGTDGHAIQHERDNKALLR